jgi:hypothetical protein
MLGWKDGWHGQGAGCYTTLVLVHCHILVDLNGASASEVSDWLRDRHNRAPRQVRMQATHDNQSLDKLCWKVASYPFKDRVQFNMSFETQGYRKGTYFNDKDLARLVLAYSELSSNGYKHLLVGSKPTRRHSGG